MGRILAIDFGSKRCGIAVTDPLKIIASGLTTVPTHELLDFLKRYLQAESVDTFVIGLPKQMNNEPSQIEPLIQKFIVALEKNIPDIPVVRIDERFSSKMAAKSMIDSGISKKKRQNKALLDEISATLILQSFLQME